MYLLGGPHSKNYDILGVYFGVPLFWESTICSQHINSLVMKKNTVGSAGRGVFSIFLLSMKGLFIVPSTAAVVFRRISVVVQTLNHA